MAASKTCLRCGAVLHGTNLNSLYVEELNHALALCQDRSGG